MVLAPLTPEQQATARKLATPVDGADDQGPAADPAFMQTLFSRLLMILGAVNPLFVPVLLATWWIVATAATTIGGVPCLTNPEVRAVRNGALETGPVSWVQAPNPGFRSEPGVQAPFLGIRPRF